jgi:hypothetical protein
MVGPQSAVTWRCPKPAPGTDDDDGVGTLRSGNGMAAAHRVDPSATHFLNVDLDIHSTHDLQSLVHSFGRKAIVLHVGRDGRTFCAHLELARVTRSADSTIRAFCALIKALPRREREVWDAAKVRDFSIGIQAGSHPNPSDFAIEVKTLKAVSDLAARIILTIYPCAFGDGPRAV